MLAGGSLGLKLLADPTTGSAADRRRVLMAVFNAGLAVLTGAVTAQAFAAVAQRGGLVYLPRYAVLIVGAAAKLYGRTRELVARYGAGSRSSRYPCPT